MNRFGTRLPRALLVAWLCLPALTAARSADNPLQGLPSKPGPHIAKIKKLGDNEWLELGKPAADPKWGRARGRNWNAALPVAPELRGAFLFGEGVHGYTKPDGRYLDDLWLYDITGHRWVCCYPGADTKTLELTIDKDGFEATKDGERLPVASQAHGYSMNAYDTDRKRFLSMPNLHGYWKKALPQREKWLEPAPADASPWLFETASGRWNRLRTGTTAPKSGYGDTLIYLPSRKQAFFAHRNEEVWFYDTAKDSWEHLGTGIIDSYLLHGPTQRSGLAAADWEAWRAMEALHDSGRARLLGVSNFSLEQLQRLCEQARVPPAFVQNRCYASRGWDRAIREFCGARGVVYQGFSLLTANRDVLGHPEMARIARRHGQTVSQVVFRFALDAGMVPLTGTTDAGHMREDLEVFAFRLEPEEVQRIERLAVT